MALVALLAAACGNDSQTPTVDPVPWEPAAAESADSRPVVEVFPARTTPPLDPNANPTTPLGELRARYLPIWSRDFDWAFPPEVCGSDWALDGIAEPTSRANLAILGDPVAAAALSVMRYEYLLSRALAAPHVLEQLCVAVATVGAARSDALDLLATYLATGSRSADPAGYPNEVNIVAASPTAVLAVTCVVPRTPDVVPTDGEILDVVSASAQLQAYLLAISRGLEDDVTDTFYRVANVTHRLAESCGELDSWATEWEQHAQGWAAEGAIWGPVDRTVAADELCDGPPPGGPDECPRNWTS